MQASFIILTSVAAFILYILHLVMISMLNTPRLLKQTKWMTKRC